MQTRTAFTFAALTFALAGCGPGETVEAPEPVMIGVEVAVTGGTVRGIVGQDGLKEYHGIPYAAPPVGERRWAPPGAIESWTDVRDATSPDRAAFNRVPREASTMLRPRSRRWTRTA